MIKIGRKIYYDITNGHVLVDTGEREAGVTETTLEQDIKDFKELSERNQGTFDVLKLEYGQYARDFAECNSYRVNIVTKTLEFSYPDVNEPEAPLVFVKPLTEQIAEIKAENESLNLAVIDIYEIILG